MKIPKDYVIYDDPFKLLGVILIIYGIAMTIESGFMLFFFGGLISAFGIFLIFIGTLITDGFKSKTKNWRNIYRLITFIIVLMIIKFSCLNELLLFYIDREAFNDIMFS